MNAEQIKQGLLELKRSYRSILQDDGVDIIDDAIAELVNSKFTADSRRGKSHHWSYKSPSYWGYRIDLDRPLKFIHSPAIGGLSTWVDVAGEVRWVEEGAPPAKQNITLRVWSDDNDYQYRDRWDSHYVLDELTSDSRSIKGRVLLRCHFDLANPGQAGPMYHLQFGGSPRAYELCWFPDVLDRPRFAYPPMDLILVCQVIAANFHWDQYIKIRETPEWRSTLRRSQAHLLSEYYAKCIKVLKHDSDNILLENLWNT